MNWEKRPEDMRERVKSLPGKKNTKEWCRGKVGRYHEVEVGWRKDVKSDAICHWFPFGNPDRGIWICYHQIICVNCGKILSHALGDDCPDRTVEEKVNG